MQVTNDTTGVIEGARHGITGGAANATVTFTTSVTNNLGGIIKGDNGSGINLDGFNANQTATIINNGTITGNGHDFSGNLVSRDGDGIDVDGVVSITNTGIIRSINAFSIPADGIGFQRRHHRRRRYDRQFRHHRRTGRRRQHQRRGSGHYSCR